MEQPWYTVEQVAERLQITQQTVRSWLRRGTLNGHDLGGRAGYRIPKAEVDAFLSDKRTVAGIPVNVIMKMTRADLELEGEAGERQAAVAARQAAFCKDIASRWPIPIDEVSTIGAQYGFSEDETMAILNEVAAVSVGRQRGKRTK